MRANRSEYNAHAALHAAARAGIVQRGPRVNRAALRVMRREQRRDAVKTAAGNAAFLLLLACCFSPLWL